MKKINYSHRIFFIPLFFFIALTIFSCTLSDGTIEYPFEGRVVRGGKGVASVPVSLSFLDNIEHDTLISDKDPLYSVSDSSGVFSFSIYRGFSCTGDLLGIVEDCSDKTKTSISDVYVALQCPDSSWKGMKLDSVSISEDVTDLGLIEMDSVCD
ncbi:MAG: hypothetical protein AUK31_04285 [Fibrobacteres bacterium CG2_30_45_31]|nr:MAG: hypothetical protein AUK31_04285 [Fibrobacteres bacterium CG2_30_45_31]